MLGAFLDSGLECLELRAAPDVTLSAKVAQVKNTLNKIYERNPHCGLMI